MPLPESPIAEPLIYLVNSRSGGQKGAELLLRTRLGKMVEIEPARIEAQLAHYATDRDRLVVAGGDGTISLVIDTLFRQQLHRRVSLFLIPLGTGNDLARSLGITPPDIYRLEPRWNEPFVRTQLPVWRYGDRYFVNYLSAGMDAKMLGEVERYRKVFPTQVRLRKLAFTTAGLRHLGYAIPSPGRIEIDGVVHSLQGKAGVIVSNLPYYAGGSPISSLRPEAEYLSVTIVDSAWDMIRLGLGRYPSSSQPVLPYYRARKIRFGRKPLPIQVDGEVEQFRETDISFAGKIAIWVPQREGGQTSPPKPLDPA